MKKQTNQNLILKTSKWVAVINLGLETYEYTTPLAKAHIHIITLENTKSSMKIEYLSSMKAKTENQTINNLYNQICCYFKKIGLNLSVQQIKKIVLSLEELKK